MITRFDHAVIAVRNIPQALQAYQALGFDVAAGGRHPSIGTQNAIVRFGLDYIELLAVEDSTQARAQGSFGGELANYLKHASGLVGFVLASSDLDEQARGLTSIDLDAQGPFVMERERPDGRRLAWQLVIPGNSPWRKPWPFLIEWKTPDDERVKWDAPGTHRNGACGVAGIELLVDDLGAAKELYEVAFGLQPSSGDKNGVDYAIGTFTLHVRRALNSSHEQELSAHGPGPFRLLVRYAGTQATDLDIKQALGARISLTPNE